MIAILQMTFANIFPYAKIGVIKFKSVAMDHMAIIVNNADIESDKTAFIQIMSLRQISDRQNMNQCRLRLLKRHLA